MSWLLHQMAKVLELQLQHQSFQCIFRTDFLRTDWFDLLAVQGTLKSLLQHHSLKASVLQHSAFFMVQLSHPKMTTGKTIALTRWTFVSKVMSLLFNILSRFVMSFPDSSVGKEFTCNVGNPGSIPGLGRSPGEGKGYPLQYFA